MVNFTGDLIRSLALLDGGFVSAVGEVQAGHRLEEEIIYDNHNKGSPAWKRLVPGLSVVRFVVESTTYLCMGAQSGVVRTTGYY